MNAWNIIKILPVLLLVFLIGFGRAVAQVPEKSIDALRERISLTDQLLAETHNQREKSLIELGLLNRQIRLREQLLKHYNQRIAEAARQIETLNESICQLQQDRQRMVRQYSRAAQAAYQNQDNLNFWLALLSSHNLVEAYYRSQYFAQFSRFRRKQIEAIRQSEALLRQQSAELTRYLQENERLRDQKQQEIRQLEIARVDQDRLFRKLKRREALYRKQLKQQQEELKRLIGQADPDYGITEAMADDEIGEAFEKNRGFHPWPVKPENAIIIQEYGISEDPFGNQVTNDGIEIRVPKGEVARAIYGGRVTGVQPLLHHGYVVIIKHGNYRTTYAYLDDVKVKPGDFVTAAQPIGVVKPKPRTEETVLTFLIYKVPAKFVDPLVWLFPQ